MGGRWGNLHRSDDLTWYYTVLVVATAWHVGLVFAEKPRLLFLIYGVVHWPIFYVVCGFAAIYAGAPL